MDCSPGWCSTSKVGSWTGYREITHNREAGSTFVVEWLIPSNVYVISFTRATCTELRTRVQTFCSTLPCAAAAAGVQVSTMHALALRILRRANLLTSYRSTPIILNDWEQTNVYDKELASSLRCLPSRAAEIRLAHDAQWQTLSAILKSSPNHAI